MPNSVSDYVPTADDLRIRSLLEESAQRAATPTPQVGSVQQRIAESVARSSSIEVRTAQ